MGGFQTTLKCGLNYPPKRIWLHLQYLISEEDYAYDKKRKMKKKGKSEKILIYSDSIEINTK